MATESPVGSAEIGGWTVEASGETAQGIKDALTPPEEKAKKDEEKAAKKQELSRAASDLGKKGGKAAAKARAAAKDGKDAKAEPEAVLELQGVDRGDKGVEAREADAASDAGADPDSGDAEKDEAAEEAKKEKLGNPRHDPKARMLEATRKESEAKRALAQEREERAREREELHRRLAAAEAKTPAEKTEAKTADEDPEPQTENFDTYEGYVKAQARWEARQEYKELSQRDQKQKQASEADKRISEAHEGFRDALEKAGVMEKLAPHMHQLRSTFQLAPGSKEDGTNWMATELVFSDPETAPAVALYLSEHEDEFQRIAALTTPRAVSREMAKIEARLEVATTGTDSERKDVEVSKAAPPVKPVSGAPHVTSSGEYREGMSYDEYVRNAPPIRRK